MAETGLEEFREDDWISILEELRLLVARSGFGAWDEAMAAALDDQGEKLRAQSELLHYLDGFARFLDARSGKRLERDRKRLMELVSLEIGGVPEDAVVVFSRRPDDWPTDDESGRPLSIFNQERSDAFLNELARFRAALLGELPGYFDDERSER